MTMGPILCSFLLGMFGLLLGSIWLQFSATSRLAKWLYRNRPEVWRELGRPGTTFFKGDPDNGYLRRTSALQGLYKTMPLHGYRKKLADVEAQRYLRMHRIAGRLAVMFMTLFAVGMFYGVERASHQGSALATALGWAKLADLPKSAVGTKIEKGGSSFTREFSIRFRDDKGNIEEWIQASPGPAAATPEVDENGWTIYSYPAGGGAQFSEVRVSPGGDEVRVRTYWS